MNLQFGSKQCDKMHIGKHHNKDICPKLFLDSWNESVQENSDGMKEIKVISVGKVEIKDVSEKKCLEDIISSDGKN